LQAHNKGDYAAERRLYRRVIQRLKAENNNELRGLTGQVRGVCVPLGYALGQTLVTIESVFFGPFGVLGWVFIGSYAAVATLLTLAIVGVTAALKRFCRTRSGTADGA